MSRTLIPRRPASPDAKRATHDGFIWPRTPSEMTDETAIRTRMVEDAFAFEDLHGDFEGINEAYFLRRGWTQTQISLNGAAAIAIATTQRAHRRAA